MNPQDPTVPKPQYPYRVTVKLRAAFTLSSEPVTLAQKFGGYLNHADPTTTAFNMLSAPSQNCFIPMKDMVVPRLGSEVIGVVATESWPIVGHKKRFTTAGGISMEVRVTKSNDYTQNDIIEVLYPNPLTGIPQWYKISYKMWNLIANTLSDWTSVVPGPHEYYMDDWFDTDTDPSQSVNSPRLIWTNGLPFIYSWLGAAAPIIDIYNVGTSYYLTTSYGQIVYSPFTPTAWIRGEIVKGATSGAQALVAGISIVNSMSVMNLIHVSGVFQWDELIEGVASGAIGTVTNYTPPENTWSSLGFTALGNESPYINIDGNAYNISNSFDTNSLLLSSSTTPPINVGDVAFSIIRADTVTTPLDVCRNNQNYMFYGNWKSRNFYMSNAFSHDAEAIITNDDAVLDDLSVSQTITGSGYHYYEILITSSGTPDHFQWSIDGGTPTTGVAITGAAQTLTSGANSIIVTFSDTTGHTIGDTWTISVVPKVANAWANFYYSLPRLPGEGYIFQLPSNFWAMEPQEALMYVNTTYGEWGTITSTLAANLLTETVVYAPLKQSPASKVLYPYLIGHLDNSLVFLNDTKKLDMIQRMKFVQLPQIGNLSNAVQNDFESLSFIGGSVEFHNKRWHITSPNEKKMLVWDDLQKYWQPPQVFPEAGILSVYNEQLIAHSNVRNQTNILFTGTNGDNGSPYTVIARTSYDSGGDRWGKKVSNASFIEGYVTGKPNITMNVYLDINGSSGVRSHLVEPITDEYEDSAPIGEGYNGQHQLGSDSAMQYPHFYEIYRSQKPVLMNYRFLAIEAIATELNHSYSYLSLGVNKINSVLGNNDITRKKVISRN